MFGSPLSSASFPDALQLLSVVFIPVAVGAAAVGLVALLFLKRAFNALAEKSEIIRFRKAGVLFSISAVVSAVFMIAAACLFVAGWFPFTSIWYFGFFSLPGGAVQLAAWALATQGFFALKQKAKQTPPAAQQPAPQSTVQVKFCSNCGAPNGLKAVYCTRCGGQL